MIMRKSERRQTQPIMDQTMKIRFSVKLNISQLLHYYNLQKREKKIFLY